MAHFRLVPESDSMLTIDLTRFVAATGVVALHFWQALSSHEGLGQSDRLDFLTLFVDVFFIISGFVIATVYSARVGTPGAYLDFMQKRIARLLPLHWATLSFFVAVALSLSAIGRQSNFPRAYDWHCVIPHALFLHAFNTCRSAAFNFPSWSISAEMALYLAFPIFLFLAKKLRPSLLALSALTLLGMYAFSGGPNGNQAQGWTNWTFDFGAIRGLAGFSFGVALYAYRGALGRVGLAFPFLLAAFVAFLGLGLSGIAPMWLAPLAYSIAFFAIASDLSGKEGPGVRRLSGLGQLTYSIYMVHIPVRFIVLVLIGEHLFHLHGGAYILWTVCSALVVLPVAWASLILLERPARRWLGRRNRSVLLNPPLEAPG